MPNEIFKLVIDDPGNSDCHHIRKQAGWDSEGHPRYHCILCQRKEHLEPLTGADILKFVRRVQMNHARDGKCVCFDCVTAADIDALLKGDDHAE